MKETPLMIYKKVLESRLARKKEELAEVDKQLEGIATPADKRKYVELRAIVNELENCIDIAEALSKVEKE